MKKRVVITGMGALTPLGNSLSETWNGLREGRSGIAAITKFDTNGFKTRIAGELKGFDPLVFVGKKEARRLDPFILYALAASEMAHVDAGWFDGTVCAERTGVLIGSAIGGLLTMEHTKETLMRSGPDRVSPFALPSTLANLAAGHISIRFGAKGPISCSVTACAAGTNAIGDAYRLIAHGYADAMIAGGVDAAVCPLAIAGFNAMRALSVRNEEPETASRPFDKTRDGFVVAEGCGILILEELALARRRNARIYAEIVGYGMTADAYHLAAPPPGHEGAVRCMRAALEDAAVPAEEIDYINAHGTSTPLNDLYETEAIKTVFGDQVRRMAVSSTKSMLGHMLGAAGAVETIIAARVITDGLIPPTINLNSPDPACDLDYVSHGVRRQVVRAALSNTFGFGGVNAVIALKAYSD